MAIYRTKKEYLVFILFICIATFSYFKASEYKFETISLQQQLDGLRAAVVSEFKVRDSHNSEVKGKEVEKLSKGLSDLGEETKDLSAKVPQLESLVSYLSSKLQEERQKHNETVTNVEKTFYGLLHKIGALEGVINDLHAHHEQHEQHHEEKDRQQKLVQREAEINSVEVGAGRKDGVEEGEEEGGDDVSTALLLVASPNRPDYLKKCLSYIAKYHPKSSVPIMVSEDGENQDVDEVVKEAFQQMRSNGVTVPLLHVHHPHHKKPAENGYFKLSRHFKWALNELFAHPLSSGMSPPRRVIVLEEDLQIAPDFFEFFAAVAPLVDSDPTVLAASAWNDNGARGFVHDPEALYRSDFFPGLGWMMSSKVWNELSPIWPNAYWDDWLREPLRRKGRHIIRPEVCRTYHYGKKGVSNNQYSTFLDDTQLNEKFIPFQSMDLSYLENKRWEKEYTSAVLAAQTVDARKVNHQAKQGILPGIASNVLEVTVFYQKLSEFESLAKSFGVMDNIKANVPRTAYHGIVSFWQKGSSPPRRVHLAPVGLEQTLIKTVTTSDTEYDPTTSKRKQNFLRPRIQY